MHVLQLGLTPSHFNFLFLQIMQANLFGLGTLLLSPAATTTVLPLVVLWVFSLAGAESGPSVGDEVEEEKGDILGSLVARYGTDPGAVGLGGRSGLVVVSAMVRSRIGRARGHPSFPAPVAGSG